MVFTHESLTTQILDAAPYAVILADERGVIVYANQPCTALFGYEPDALIGQSVDALVPDARRGAHADRRAEFLRAARPRPMGMARDIRALRADGSEVPIDIMLSPLHVDGRQLVLAMARDDTERRESERRLAALSADLESKNLELSHRNRELEAFAFTASHDLQEPLRKIVAFGDRLKKRLGPVLDETSGDYLARMLDAARRMQNLIEDLLRWSRISRGAELQAVDLDMLVAATLRDLELAIERSGGRVELGPLGSVTGDPGQLRTLFQNLIDNALKYRREGVPPVVRVGAERDGRTVRIVVSDNGIGFEEKYRERIFEIFERLHARHEYEGTGIGLALCRKIAERHGGTISASSRPGEGSTFAVTLPERREQRSEP